MSKSLFNYKKYITKENIFFSNYKKMSYTIMYLHTHIFNRLNSMIDIACDIANFSSIIFNRFG